MDKTSISKHKKKDKYLLIKVFVLFVIIAFFSYSLFGFAKRVIHANNKKEEAYNKLTELKQRSDKIETKLDKLNSSYSQDEIIKNEMGQSDPDEHTIIFVKPDK